ncbi:kinase-like protein [Didymella exigua CBS 183.55]|uniref:Kinase-like protein n=1 Tax=Didymella exigua CBS 183.55 TaxID=1150837 RepID=A0A6A5RVJ3_9PLEO|nr:kinase-like protein [Didymella exigua CBS 183.55]KAF1930998.1 kinase-like protein [Didymella exigua CBS 183.55]
MSMFRRPGDSSSSSSEASYDQKEDAEQAVTWQHGSVSRVNTLEPDASERPINAQRPSLDTRGFSTQDIQALTFHAMLEQNAITTAAARLHVEPTDAEAQRQGKEAYQEIARQLPNGMDTRYANDEFRALRTQMQERLHQTTIAHLQAIEEGPGITQSLVRRHRNGRAVGTQPPLADIQTRSDLPAPAPWFADFQNDRYARDFSELEMVGKGGYGKVFKVKHKLDGHFYAVKRIIVPQAKLAKGPDELNSILEEVRSLATFDHANIVRYHNAWLEYTAMPTETQSTSTTTMLPNNRLLEDAAKFASSPSDVGSLDSKFDGIDFGEPSADYDAGIVFEASDAEAADDSGRSTHRLSLREQLSVKRRNRRTSQASQATIATISSTRSRMSAVEDVSEDSDDDEIEMIQRRHRPSSQEATTELSDSMVSYSDMPERALMRTRSAGPALTLNVQMSLYESNLAAFLSPERASCSSSTPALAHCFHACVSLELLGSIAAGVEYLHSQGVVHRDLKPANVFLALSTARRAPYGSVDLSTCKPCPERGSVHVVPRIGDFGLVAALDDRCAPAAARPVGTELYRPATRGRNSDKLDVFALGVMAVEMLCRFGTSMERGAALSRLKTGAFPEGFALRLGVWGDRIQQLVGAMVLADEEARMGCEEARSEIAGLVKALRGDEDGCL